MKNKIINVFTLLMLIFLIGCSNELEEHDFDLSGEYIYGDCVYLNYFSSSTKENETELYKDLYYFDFSDNALLQYSNESELIATYENVEFVIVDKELYLDDFNLTDLDEFLNLVEYRYDIYSNDQLIDFTVFQSETSTYVADSRMIGENNDIFVFWSVFELIEN